MIYDFKQQLARGQSAEQWLDGFFSQWYITVPATMEQQRQGIDRIFVRKDNNDTYKIEYKTDWTAGKTGNAFVETVSVDTTNKLGWAYSSQSDYLIYYIPGDMLIYVIQFLELRNQLPRWCVEFRSRRIPNRGYYTIGLLVPLDEFERIAKEVISI